MAAIVSTDRVCCEGGAVPVWDVEGYHGGEGICSSVSDGPRMGRGDETYKERKVQSGGQAKQVT